MIGGVDADKSFSADPAYKSICHACLRYDPNCTLLFRWAGCGTIFWQEQRRNHERQGYEATIGPDLHKLYQAGVVCGTGEDLSARSVEQKGALWITNSMVFKGALRAQDMILIDLDGNILEG